MRRQNHSTQRTVHTQIYTHTHTTDSPIQTVYVTSTNVSEEQLRREVILKGLIPLRELYISSYVSVSTNRAVG